MNKNLSENGSVLIEAVISVTIFLVIILGMVGAISVAFQTALANLPKIQATYLGEEGLEAIRVMRDVSWTGNIASKNPGTPFYLNFNGTTWVSTASNVFIDGKFERRIIMNSVFRDGNQNIVTSGGTLDPNIRKVTSYVAWYTGKATTTHSISTYITNAFNN